MEGLAAHTFRGCREPVPGGDLHGACWASPHQAPQTPSLGLSSPLGSWRSRGFCILFFNTVGVPSAGGFSDSPLRVGACPREAVAHAAGSGTVTLPVLSATLPIRRPQVLVGTAPDSNPWGRGSHLLHTIRAEEQSPRTWGGGQPRLRNAWTRVQGITPLQMDVALH